MKARNWLLGAAVEVIVLMLAAALLLNRPYHHPVHSPASANDLRVIYKVVTSVDDIEPLPGPAVPPIAYTSAISFAPLDVKVKKKKFFDLMLPAIMISKHKLARLRQRIIAFTRKKRHSKAERRWFTKQLKRFDADNYQQLLQRTEDHPVSIVLAQAAVESGWGDSRFFTEANNAFGVWSFNPDEPRVKAGENREGKEVYVKKYNSLIDSVDDYFLTIARGPYGRFRRARLQDDDPFRLISHLTRYSEQRQEYVQRLREVIEKNDLQRYDSFFLDPRYLVQKMGG